MLSLRNTSDISINLFRNKIMLIVNFNLKNSNWIKIIQFTVVIPSGGITVDFLWGLLGSGVVPLCLLPVECRRIGIIPANLLLEGGTSSSVEGTWRKFEDEFDPILLIFTNIQKILNKTST